MYVPTIEVDQTHVISPGLSYDGAVAELYNNALHVLNNARTLVCISNQKDLDKKITEKKEFLEEAHRYAIKLLFEYPNESNFLFLESAILISYGALLNDTAPLVCHLMALKALFLQKKALHLVDDAIDFNENDSLAVLEIRLAQEGHKVRPPLKNSPFLLDLYDIAHTTDLTENEAYVFSEVLSWYGISALPFLKSGPHRQEQQESLVSLFQIAESIYKEHLDKPSFCGGYATLCLKGLYPLSLLKDPKNLNSAHHHLDEAKALLPSFDIMAQVAHQKAINYKMIQDLRKAREFIKSAFDYYTKVSPDEQDLFFLANLHHDYGAHVVCHEWGGGSIRAEEHIQFALNYAEEKRGKRDDDDHLIDVTGDRSCFGSFNLSMVKIKVHQGKFMEAIKHLNRAVESLEKDIDRVTERALAETLRKTIEPMLKQLNG